MIFHDKLGQSIRMSLWTWDSLLMNEYPWYYYSWVPNLSTTGHTQISWESTTIWRDQLRAWEVSYVTWILPLGKGNDFSLLKLILILNILFFLSSLLVSVSNLLVFLLFLTKIKAKLRKMWLLRNLFYKKRLFFFSAHGICFLISKNNVFYQVAHCLM